MTTRNSIWLMLVVLVLGAVLSADAQPGDRYLNMKARVLQLVFPLDAGKGPFFERMILRFGDSDTQIAIVVYPGGRAEVIRYTLAGLPDDGLSHLISEMTAKNPDVTDKDIAAQLKVETTRSPIAITKLDPALDALRKVRISPVLASRTAVDNSSEYEFWYDGWQESVHYTITTPFADAPQDDLGRWMARLRSDLPDLLKSSSPK